MFFFMDPIAVLLDEKNTGLLANYALALLVAQQPKRALGVITNACRIDPNDGDAHQILIWVKKINHGETECPTKLTAND